MSVWIFGDSFADQYTPENTWMQQVADGINQEPKFCALSGTTLDYTYEKFNEVREQIQEKDIVIVALTDLSRRWFFRDLPQETIWMTMEKGGEHSKSIREFLRFLEHNNIYITYLMSFLYNVQYLTKQRNTHTIILPCFDYVCEETERVKPQFPQMHFGNRALVRISVNELEDGMVERLSMLKKGLDLRYSHMIKSNHTILANKVINNIKNNEPINLREGFVEKILNPTVLTDYEFGKTELFNVQRLDFYDRVCELLRKS